MWRVRSLKEVKPGDLFCLPPTSTDDGGLRLCLYAHPYVSEDVPSHINTPDSVHMGTLKDHRLEEVWRSHDCVVRLP